MKMSIQDEKRQNVRWVRGDSQRRERLRREGMKKEGEGKKRGSENNLGVCK